MRHLGGNHSIRDSFGFLPGLLFALAFAIAQTVSASEPEPVVVPKGQYEAINITPQTAYYRDPTGELTLTQVLALPDYAWQTMETDALRFGFTDDVFWLRLKVQQPNRQPSLLVGSRSLFDRIEAFFVGSDQSEIRATPDQQAGNRVPPMQRPSLERRPVLKLNFQGERDIYLRTQTSSAYILGLTLVDQETYRHQETTSMMFHGSFFSILAFASLLFFIVALALRHKALFALGIITLFSGLSEATMSGVFSVELWDPEMTYAKSLSFYLGIALIATYYFFTETLELKTTSPWAEIGLRIVAFACLLTMLASSFIGHQLTLSGVTALGVITTLTVLLVAGRLSLAGNRFAIYTVVASAAALVGYMQRALAALQMNPSNVFYDNAFYFGFLFMLFCLALGLGFEMRTRQKALDEHSQTLALERSRHQQAANEELEQVVKSRTQELETALSELADANESLKLLNTVDQVTGVKNRYFFDTSFEQEWKRASREHYPISLLMLDVDHFKTINDTYGHVVGDECLRQIASRIDGNIKRASDTLARFGGEEFVVLLPFADNDSAMVLAEQVRRSLEAEPLIVEDEKISVQLSAGVCTVIPSEEDTPKDLITSADLALYEAKSTGRNRVCNAGNLKVHRNASA